MKDIIIIGAGPAGLTAAIYAVRAGKSVTVIEKSTFGGQMTFSPKIENYPGFAEISGNELADKMVEQALGLGAEIECAEVTAISYNKKQKFYTLTTPDGDFEAKSVIIAVGSHHRRLGLEGEEELVGHGISFCAVCDGAFYTGGEVAVIGGGNSAAVEALLLAKVVKKLTIVQNLPDLTCEASTAAELKSMDNVEIIYNTVVEEYVSDGGELTGLIVKNTETVDLTKNIYPVADNHTLEERNQGIVPAEHTALAKKIAAADRIVIAAPFWDMSFPSALKVFFENMSLFGVAFDTNDKD